MAGNTIDISGPVGKSARVYGNQVMLTNTVGRDFDGGMQNLMIAGKGKILGNLNYESPNKSIIPAGAVVGKTAYKAVEEKIDNKIAVKPMVKPFMSGFKIVSSFFGFLLALLVGLMLIKLIPTKMAAVNEVINAKPWLSWLVGLAILMLSPADAMAIAFLREPSPESAVLETTRLISVPELVTAGVSGAGSATASISYPSVQEPVFRFYSFFIDTLENTFITLQI